LSTNTVEAVETITLSVYGNIINFQQIQGKLRILLSMTATVIETNQRDTSYLPVKQVLFMPSLLRTYAQK